MEREWDEVEENMEPTYRHDVHEPTTYELAEMELKEQEQYMRYYFDDKYEMI